MKILFIANRFPYPPFRGDKLKIFNLARRLSAKHDLYLLSFYEKRSELEDLQYLKPYFKDFELVYLPKWRSVLNCVPALFTSKPLQLAYFWHPKLKKRLNQLLGRHDIDLVYTQHLRMSQYSRTLHYPKIIDLPDAFSLYWKRRRETARPWYLKIIDHIEISRLVKYEKVINEFDLCLVCSEEDKRYLEKLHSNRSIDISLNGVDLETFRVGEGHNYSNNTILLFTGNMDYAPNVDAVVHFTRNLWPEIRRRHLHLKFVIAGQRPVKVVRDLASDSVEVTGFVPDLMEVYRHASVVVAPLRFGAGTQNKVLEAMAMGVPVVCTRIGFEGLQVKTGEGVMLGSTDAEFIEKVLYLLDTEKNRRIVGEAGLEIARSRFSWDVIANKLDTYFHRVRDSHS